MQEHRANVVLTLSAKFGTICQLGDAEIDRRQIRNTYVTHRRNTLTKEKRMIKIVLDAFGGDNSPQANLDGAIKALQNIDDLHVTIVGDENIIKDYLGDKFDPARMAIVHAPDVISCDEKPTEAIKNKKDSSMARSFELLRSDPEIGGMVSTGSTGALLAGAVLRIGRIKGVKRPAFCPTLPTINGGKVCICDSGANVDCDAVHLSQFATMASLYMQKAYGVKNPRVALLNIGVESEKGDALRKEVYTLLQENPNINFVGNMESRNLLSGEFDLVVSDGFSGNVLLKSTEGSCMEMMKMLKKIFLGSFHGKLGAMFLKKDIYALKNMMDYNNYGGAVLLGTSKTIVKGHGSSKAEAVFHCLEQAYNMEKNGLNAAIAEQLTK